MKQEDVGLSLTFLRLFYSLYNYKLISYIHMTLGNKHDSVNYSIQVK